MLFVINKCLSGSENISSQNLFGKRLLAAGIKKIKLKVL
jgi:hypothetical protein